MNNYKTFVKENTYIYTLFGFTLDLPLPFGIPFSPFGYFGMRG